LEVLYTAWGGRSEENARRARDDLFTVQNSRKARVGGLAGLMDPAIMARKKSQEKQLRTAVNVDAKLKAAAGAWDTVGKTVARQKDVARDYNLLEGRRENAVGFNSQLFLIARQLLRGGDERPKPNGERLTEYRDSNLESLQLQLFSEEPIHDDFELVRLG